MTDQKNPPPRISKLDLWVYRLFFWRWKPLLMGRPDLLALFEQQLESFKQFKAEELALRKHLRLVKADLKK